MNAETRALAVILAANRGALEALGVRHLSLFGSRVRGDARPDSDLDVLIDLIPARSGPSAAAPGNEQPFPARSGPSAAAPGNEQPFPARSGPSAAAPGNEQPFPLRSGPSTAAPGLAQPILGRSDVVSAARTELHVSGLLSRLTGLDVVAIERGRVPPRMAERIAESVVEVF